MPSPCRAAPRRLDVTRYPVRLQVSGVSRPAIGLVLIIAGIAGVVLSLIYMATARVSRGGLRGRRGRIRRGRRLGDMWIYYVPPHYEHPWYTRRGRLSLRRDVERTPPSAPLDS